MGFDQKGGSLIDSHLQCGILDQLGDDVLRLHIPKYQS